MFCGVTTDGPHLMYISIPSKLFVTRCYPQQNIASQLLYKPGGGVEQF